MTNPFGDEFDAPEEPEGPPNEIKYDRWGRYANLPAIPGVVGVQPWTRVTTLAKTFEDTYHLDLWKQRQIIRGLAEKPALLDLVSGPRFNPDSSHGKGVLNSIASQAMEEVGSYDGADAGTRFHDLAERQDGGEIFSLDDLSPTDTRMLSAYDRIKSRAGIKILPEMMERVIAVPELGVAGRLDRVVLDNGKQRIGDLKSQKTLDFGHISLCIQFACYANAPYVLNMETWQWEEMPKIDREIGVIMWVPAIEAGRAEIHEVDIKTGWQFAKAAARIREWRKRKDLVNHRIVR